MADEKISETPAKATLHDTDLVPIVDIEAIPDTTKYITGANLKSQVLAGHKDLTTGVHGVGTETINDLYDIAFSRLIVVPAYAGWTESTSGTASITQSVGQLQLASGATDASVAICSAVFAGYIGADEEPIYEYDIKPNHVTDVTFQIALGSGADPTVSNKNYIGIEVINNALYALSCDGTTRSTLDLSTTLSAWTTYRIKQRLASGVLYTWVSASAKTNKTTNLPSSGNIPTWMFRFTNTAAANKALSTYIPKVVWKG